MLNNLAIQKKTYHFVDAILPQNHIEFLTVSKISQLQTRDKIHFLFLIVFAELVIKSKMKLNLLRSTHHLKDLINNYISKNTMVIQR